MRILHLGDSHIAADYITGTIRTQLQRSWGGGGRGFTAADQRFGYGGRVQKTSFSGWIRDRIVDGGRAGRPFGFSGVSLESTRAGARLVYRLEGERRVRLFFHRQPGGGRLLVKAAKKRITTIDTSAPRAQGAVEAIEVPAAPEIELVALGPKVRLFGLSFEGEPGGLYYDAIGPVGADAKVYLELERASFEQQIRALAPDLVVVMVGGNDAMKIRKRWRTLAEVRRHHELLIDRLRAAAPEADCLIWAPMDAGQRAGARIESKAMIREVRRIQEEVARSKSCGFWDLLESMGGAGAIEPWFAAGLINRDLVHPRRRGAQILGSLFAESFRSTINGLDAEASR